MRTHPGEANLVEDSCGALLHIAHTDALERKPWLLLAALLPSLLPCEPTGGSSGTAAGRCAISLVLMLDSKP